MLSFAIGNRVGVMSVSRVQIPDSPPDYRTLLKDKVRFLLFCEEIWYIFARKYGTFLRESIFLTTILTTITHFWRSQSSGSASPCALRCRGAWPVSGGHRCSG